MFIIIALTTFLSVHVAFGKGGKSESECEKFLRSSSIEDVRNLAKQLMLTQTKTSTIDQNLNVKYIDRVKGELGIIVDALSSIEVTGYGPTPDPNKGKAEDHGKPFKSYYLNLKNGKKKVKIEVFIKDTEIEIIAEGYGRYERYILSQEGDNCLPLQKFSGIDPAKLKNETDTYYCAEMRSFYSRFKKYENMIGVFDYEECDKFPACQDSARDIYNGRFVKRTAEYLQSSARPAIKIEASKEFTHVNNIRAQYSDQCSNLLKKSSRRSRDKKVETPVVTPATDSKKSEQIIN